MFGKKSKESEQPENLEFPEMTFSPPTTLDMDSPNTDDAPETFDSTPTESQPEMVNMVEKISSILSPYFIVVVGLFLYEDNFLIGTSLIALGILSLLKISFKDIGKWINSIKNSLKN
jgi:hypothetical protein